jgi:hypothetical protein
MEKDMTEEKFYMHPKDIVELFKKFEMEKKDTKNPKKTKPTGRKRPKNHDGLPLMERCQAILGKRMRERKGVGYMLDGVHVSCERLLREAGLFLLD